jgi:hypothetical protein
VARTALFEHGKHVIDCLLVLAQDPIPVLAHDRQPQEHDGLPAAYDRAQAALVELAREVEVDRRPRG